MRNHRLLGVVVASAAAFASALAPARAEIYTYVDPQGRVNVSNLAPPDGARVTRVVHEAPPNPYNDAAREAAQRDEMQRLAQRVDQLQYELQLAARQPPPAPAPQVVVVPMPAPAPAPYYVDAAPAPAYAQDCSYGWNGCDAWWGGAFAPFATFVYVPSGRGASPGFRGGRDAHGGGHFGRPPMPMPMPRRPPLKMAALHLR